MNVKLSSKPEEVEDAAAIILPGVGAFAEAMEHIRRLKLYDVLKSSVQGGKPFFGVCLGLQLLFERSEEFGITEGLGLIPGEVKTFKAVLPRATRNRIPHVGWSLIKHGEVGGWKGTPLQAIEEDSHFYFVHSYVAIPSNKESILSLTEYGGIEFVSSVRLGQNLIATQFHPEKSGENGLEIYRTWARQNDLISETQQ
jgi:glutamine amidotransferase